MAIAVPPATVFSARWRNVEGRWPSGKDRLEPRLRRSRRPACGYRTGRGGRASCRRDRTRWKQTALQWPMVSATFDGISRNAFMARHRANHVNIAYPPDETRAAQALAVKCRHVPRPRRPRAPLRGGYLQLIGTLRHFPASRYRGVCDARLRTRFSLRTRRQVIRQLANWLEFAYRSSKSKDRPDAGAARRIWFCTVSGPTEQGK
jgi:hypothetical protein